MNETDFIRQQLASERTHLREILAALRIATPAAANARASVRYVEWARQRLVRQLDALCGTLQATATGHAEPPARLERLTTGLDAVRAGAADLSLPRQAEALVALLDAGEPLEAIAGKTLRIAHWRQTAQLSADSILEERQLYTAARAALGMSAVGMA